MVLIILYYQDNLGTNTYSSALLVGEKAASLLLEDLGAYRVFLLNCPYMYSNSLCDKQVSRSGCHMPLSRTHLFRLANLRLSSRASSSSERCPCLRA